jgi:hypothetical protein
MSTLNVDALVGNTSANAITVRGEGSATTSLQQGLAKAWVNFTGVSTTAARDSFNVGSLTDISTGKTSVVYTNAMANGNYAGSYYTSASAGSDFDAFNNAYTGSFGIGTDQRTTALVKVASHNNSGLLDSFANDVTINGDLA